MIWPSGRSTELPCGPDLVLRTKCARSATHPGNFGLGEPSSAGREDNPAADLAAAQFFEDVVRLSERAGGDLAANFPRRGHGQDRKSTRLNSSHANISYAVFCLKKKKHNSIHIC